MSSPAVSPFEFATAARVVFGCGTPRASALVKELTELEGCADAPALIVAGASDRFSAPLAAPAEGGRRLRDVPLRWGEPSVATAEAAIALAKEHACGAVIAIGGGTPVDTGKCVAAVLTNGGPTPDLYDFLEVVGRARPLTSGARRSWRCPPPPAPRGGREELRAGGGRPQGVHAAPVHAPRRRGD